MTQPVNRQRAIIKRGKTGLYQRRDGQPGNGRHTAKTLPEYLEAEEVASLLVCAPSPQAALVMLLQWRGGLRVSEAITLTPADVTLDGHPGTLRVMGKGKKQRVIPIHPELSSALKTLMTYGGIDKATEIIDAHRSTAWRWVTQAMKEAEERQLLPPGKEIGTHTLRHSAARHWLSSGVPINVVSLWLGHASIQTTLIYLQILPDQAGYMERVP